MYELIEFFKQLPIAYAILFGLVLLFDTTFSVFILIYSFIRTRGLYQI